MSRHVVALPFPGRGDINPVMDLCRSLVYNSNQEDKSGVHVTLALTNEWFAVFGRSSGHSRIHVACIEDFQLPDLEKSGDFHGFIEAVLTKMETPLERFLDRLEKPPCLLIADSFLLEAVVRIGDRRNLPVAAFWPTTAAMLTLYHQFHLLEQNGHYNLDLPGSDDIIVDYIPGLSPMSLKDTLGVFNGLYDFVLPKFRKSISLISKTKCVLISTFQELEQNTVNSLYTLLKIPIFTIATPREKKKKQCKEVDDYITWLNKQEERSVLYVSFGSRVPVSPQQIDEIVAGLVKSGVKFLLVTRSEAERVKERVGERGFVVSWCDQIRVLSLVSVGGFWTHCGWNSTKEAIFEGLPLLTFPYFGDQILISMRIVNDWKIGARVREGNGGMGMVVGRERICGVVKRFMDENDVVSREMRLRVKKIQKMVVESVGDEKLSKDVDLFVKMICEV